MVNQRRSLLDYLKQARTPRATRHLIERLGLRR